ncbi:Uncharacterised protein [Candidatus Gugararchaeum adminiculabundum]|nr:Uncharacterised protein [Candidatus Gugararchaeum adminiculabundum]
MAAIPIILGFPLTMWLGALTLISLLITATLGYGFYKQKIHRIPFTYHMYAAALTLLLALIHIASVIYLYYL